MGCAPKRSSQPSKSLAELFRAGARGGSGSALGASGLGKGPGARLAVFFPELKEQRALVERTFRNVFYPSSALHAGILPEDCVFHIDAAPALYTQPLIASALLLLELANPRLDITKAGAILRSPFLPGSVAERSLRAQADLDLKRRREMDVSLRDWSMLRVTVPCSPPTFGLRCGRSLSSGPLMPNSRIGAASSPIS